MKRRYAIAVTFLALTVLALLVAGCSSISSDAAGVRDEKPWNSPAAWEGSVLGVPY